MITNLSRQAESLVKLLKKKRARLVLAESCTGGLLASLLTEVPGVSDYFCGSFVTYRENSKNQWIGVKASTLKKYSAVSIQTAEEMVRGALKHTPEATIGASVTGYLGPKGELLGQVFVSVLLKRSKSRPVTTQLSIDFDSKIAKTKSRAKTKRSRVRLSPKEMRLARRDAAASSVLFLVRSLLNS